MRREPLGGWLCVLGLVLACGPGIDERDSPSEHLLQPPSTVVVMSIAINDAAPEIQLLVLGTDFIPATAVYVRQTAVPTEFVSSTELRVQLDPNLVEGLATFPLELRVAPGNPPFLQGATSPIYTVSMPGR
ncbi:hypothetical protein [Myxococcus qinghaiensis]|uniref:hypothetical protein n=1 Tax=Myxococcus qinghaiensis TaxID=2906758 RepID=UPI0020A6FF82|nr:hypothetical protein [Myxococcus qinghaiensis]MCP3170097.1 hypothetical protein [Myxococcus qinghaiensis]